MIDVLVQRQYASRFGIFGRLYAPGLTLFTGELAYHDNLPDISSFPAGKYRGVWGLSPRFKRNLYGIYTAPNRAGLRIHSANFMGDDPLHRQLNGCMALGEKVGMMDGQMALLVSRPAVTRFENFMAGKPFNLEVRDVA